MADVVGRSLSAQQSLAGTKLAAANGAEGDQFGYPLAASGNVLAVGAANATIEGRRAAGAVYVFLRDAPAGPWVERRRLAPEGDFHSSEMCIAIDGDTLVVGAPYTTLATFQEGAVYIFERNAGGDDNWGEVARLTDPGAGAGGHFGSAIAIENGLLVVGASAAGQHHGRVQIFERDRGGAGNWGLVTTLSHAAAQDAAFVRAFGSAVALDGDLLLIGAEDTDVSYLNMADGAACLFQRDEANRDQWSYVTRLISPGADRCVGGRKLSDFWATASAEESAEAKRCALGDSRTANDDFGCAVLLQGDLAVIGARFSEGQDGSYSVGAAHVFRRDGSGSGQWLHAATLTPGETTGFAYFGTALALAGDTLVVGAPGTNAGQGKAYVFERNAGGPDGWGETRQLLPGDGPGNADFGSAAALDGESIVVGAMGDSDWRGAVYIFAPPVSQEPPTPACQPTGELANGVVIQGANGVLLGALEASLGSGQPLSIWIHEVEAPAQALWPGVTPVGLFYNIGAVTTTAAGEQPFGIALPVPGGADTAHLGIALFDALKSLVEEPGADDEWLIIPGCYDSESRLVSFALPYLFNRGSTVVLVEGPNLQPLPLPSDETSGAFPQVRSLTTENPEFRVECGEGFTSDDPCLPEDKAAFERRLQDAYDKFAGLGYDSPALTRDIIKVNVLGITILKLKSHRYIGNLLFPSPDDAGTVKAATYRHTGHIEFYYRKRVGDDDYERILNATVRHEMFHAFQYGFEAVKADWQKLANTEDPHGKAIAREDFDWIIEGTAAAAQDSGETMSRCSALPLPLHPIDVGLTASHKATDPDPYDPMEYRAQDFWVYFGRKKNLGLSYLKPLFALGASPAAVDMFFITGHGTTLGAEYWAWVKNQAIEKTIDFDGILKNPGQIDTEITGWPRELLYPQADSEPSVHGTLGRLTSTVVRITFSAGADGETGYAVTVKVSDAGGLAYRIYREGETDFADVKDNLARDFEAGTASFIVYVLLSNMHYTPDTSLSYRVSVVRS